MSKFKSIDDKVDSPSPAALLQISFIIMKLAHVGDVSNWAWWQVLMPFEIACLIGLTGLLYARYKLKKMFRK